MTLLIFAFKLLVIICLQRKYKVTRKELRNSASYRGISTWTVTISDTTFPTCDNCDWFNSTLIPCAHINTALQMEQTKDVFDEANLAPRWRLCNHPLYKTAMSQLGLRDSSTSESVQEPASTLDSVRMHSEFEKQQYNAVSYSSNSKKRYNTLIETLMTAANLASQGDAHTYKMAVLMSNDFLSRVQALRRGDDGNGDVDGSDAENLMPNYATSVREPMTQATQTTEDLQNRSRLVLPPSLLSKRKRIGDDHTCSSCFRKGHHKNSSNCPNYQSKAPESSSAPVQG